MARQGFTLVELLLSLIVTAIVGAALVRMVLGQAQFMDQQEAWRGARSVSRSGINRLLSDLRAVEALNGMEAVHPSGQDFTILVPYAFGVICRTAATLTTVSLLPVDATMFAAPGYSGFAWRNAAGVYTYVPGTALPVIPGTTADCNGALPAGFGIQTLGSINGSPGGQVANLTHAAALPTAPPNGALVGSIIFMYRRVRYEFKDSAVLPGRVGLWRTTVSSGDTEELAAPFANTARINFYRLNSATPEMAVPAQLSEIRGLELILDGMSERTPGGSTAPKTSNVRTSVFFENRPD
jgi:prepilin-type N-terminal cleavage/methylation domain-containing protein